LLFWKKRKKGGAASWCAETGTSRYESERHHYFTREKKGKKDCKLTLSDKTGVSWSYAQKRKGRGRGQSNTSNIITKKKGRGKKGEMNPSSFCNTYKLWPLWSKERKSRRAL